MTHNTLGYSDPVTLENGALGILWFFLSYSSHLISSSNYTVSHQFCDTGRKILPSSSIDALISVRENLAKGTRSLKSSRYLTLVVSLHCCRSNLVIKDVSTVPINLYFLEVYNLLVKISCRIKSGIHDLRLAKCQSMYTHILPALSKKIW